MDKFMHVVGLLYPLSNRMFYICSDVLVGQLESESVDYLAFAGRQQSLIHQFMEVLKDWNKSQVAECI